MNLLYTNGFNEEGFLSYVIEHQDVLIRDAITCNKSGFIYALIYNIDTLSIEKLDSFIEYAKEWKRRDILFTLNEYKSERYS